MAAWRGHSGSCPSPCSVLCSLICSLNPLQQTGKSVFLSSVSLSSKISNLRRMWHSPNLQPQLISQKHGACTWHFSKNCLEKVSPWPKQSVLSISTMYTTPWNTKTQSPVLVLFINLITFLVNLPPTCLLCTLPQHCWEHTSYWLQEPQTWPDSDRFFTTS